MQRPAIFLDRDGTLNADVGYTHRLDDLRLLEGVVPALTRLASLGFTLVIVTNQSGVARGYFSESDMLAFNAALVERLRQEDIAIAKVCCCPFHPDTADARYRRDTPLRKPRPGMLLEAARELNLDLLASYGIGDKKSDVLAAQAAGCRAVLVQTGAGGRGEPELVARPDFAAFDLLEAALWIERQVQPLADAGAPARARHASSGTTHAFHARRIA